MFFLALILSTTVSTPAEVAEDGRLKAAANRGDKRAAYDLGRRYEDAHGGHCDIAIAKHWYERAANDSFQEPNSFYAAPVGLQKYGRIVRLGPRLRLPGLPEAKERLKSLRETSCPRQGQGVRQAEGISRTSPAIIELP
jgi:TPR repeat protein